MKKTFLYKTIYFSLALILFSCQSREKAPVSEIPVAEKKDTLIKKEVTLDSKLKKIKAELDSLPFYPPNHNYEVNFSYLEKDGFFYKKLNYNGSYFRLRVIYDTTGLIRLITTLDITQKNTSYTFYYFEKERLVFVYDFNHGIFIRIIGDVNKNSSCFYYENEKLIYATTQDADYETDITRLDSSNIFILDITKEENENLGEVWLKNAKDALIEAKEILSKQKLK